MQASFIGFKAPDGDVLLICSRDLLPTTLKRLSMFRHAVPRPSPRCVGRARPLGPCGKCYKNIAAGAYPAWAKWDIEQDSVINLYPAATVHRQLMISPVSRAAPEGAEMELPVWQWGEVMSGVATLSNPVFVGIRAPNVELRICGGREFQKRLLPGSRGGGA